MYKNKLKILFWGGGSIFFKEKKHFFLISFQFDFIECFTTTFLRAHSWLNWVDEDDDEVGLKEKPEDTRYIKKITSKYDPKHRECGQRT